MSNALDITPFTRKIWKSVEIRNEWEDKVRRAREVFNEAEWKTVANGNRDVCTVHMNKNDYDYLNKKLTEDEMYWYPLHKTAPYSGFSHKHIKPEDDNYNWYGVASKSKEKIMKFKEADEQGEHKIIGKLLDFPECCRNSFNKRWPENIDPMFPAAKKTEGGEYIQSDGKDVVKLDNPDIESLQVLRYFGLRMTSHLPCSFDCEETKEKAKYWKKSMRDIDLGGYNILEEIMEMPFKWDANNGIVEVTTPIFKGITTTGLYNKRKIIKKGKLDW